TRRDPRSLSRGARNPRAPLAASSTGALMQPLSVSEVRPPAVYEPVRADARRQVIELKRHRRVALGELLTLVFENRETVRGVVEELLRAERIEEPQRIAEELDVFNALI